MVAFHLPESHLILEPEDLPAMVWGLARLVLAEESVRPWLTDPEAFDGQSPVRLLSFRHSLDEEEFRRRIQRFLKPFLEATEFATVMDMPTVEELGRAVAVAQDRYVSEQFPSWLLPSYARAGDPGAGRARYLGAP